MPFATRRPTFNETRRVVARLAAVNYKVEVAEEEEEKEERETETEEDEDGATSDRDYRDRAGLSERAAERLWEVNARAAAAAAALGGLG